MDYILGISVAAVVVVLAFAALWHMRRRRMDAILGQQRTRRIAEYKTWQWLFGRSKHRRLTYKPASDEAPKP